MVGGCLFLVVTQKQLFDSTIRDARSHRDDRAGGRDVRSACRASTAWRRISRAPVTNGGPSRSVTASKVWLSDRLNREGFDALTGAPMPREALSDDAAARRGVRSACAYLTGTACTDNVIFTSSPTTKPPVSSTAFQLRP